LQPPVPQFPLLLHPEGEQLPPDFVPHDEQAITQRFYKINLIVNCTLKQQS
jgi:hypothetical protein